MNKIYYTGDLSDKIKKILKEDLDEYIDDFEELSVE